MTAAPFLTAAEIALAFRVPLGTVYRWASQDTWPRTNTHTRPVYYSYIAACASYIRREGHRQAA